MHLLPSGQEALCYSSETDSRKKRRMDTCHFGSEACPSKNQRIPLHDKQKNARRLAGYRQRSPSVQNGECSFASEPREVFCYSVRLIREKKKEYSCTHLISLRVGARAGPKTQRIQLTNANHVCSIFRQVALGYSVRDFDKRQTRKRASGKVECENQTVTLHTHTPAACMYAWERWEKSNRISVPG